MTMSTRALLAILFSMPCSMLWWGGAAAEDLLKIAIGQRGGWEQGVSEIGQNQGFFKRHGLVLEILHPRQRRNPAIRDLR